MQEYVDLFINYIQCFFLGGGAASFAIAPSGTWPSYATGLAQDLYLESTVEAVGGREVVLQLANPYLDKGHIIYCNQFFYHLDLAAYLRSRITGKVGTSALT